MPHTEELRFAGSAGARLAGVLHRPDGDAHGSVLLAHCFTCSKDLHTMTRLSTGLAEAGYVALRFDFTGIGESAGQFDEKTLSTNVGDLARAAHALIERGLGPCAMVGHSLGGAAVLLAAHKVKAARSLAVIGAPSDAEHVTHLFVDDLDEIRATGRATVRIGGRAFPISREFVDDLAEHDQSGRVAELGRPLLVLHAVDDEIVSVDQGERIFAAARQPKAFVPLLGADHLLTKRSKAEEALRVLVDWLDRTR